MPDDDPSVLGNLPRSRPGRRSDKRAGAKARAKPKQPAAPAPKPRRPASSKPRTTRAATSSQSSRRPPARPQPTDPVSGAIRLAGQVAGAGMKVAGEVLKRLPRP
jgi:hypothetical protein